MDNRKSKIENPALRSTLLCAKQGRKWLIGTSGYSFADWVGPFYPAGTRTGDMFRRYVEHFTCVELNFTFYAMPAARTLARLAAASPEAFQFWVKVNRQITHDGQTAPAAEFLAALDPLQSSNRLAGVILQFPQSFHRTVEHRKFLAAALERFAAVPSAVEFRHASWDHPSTFEGLRDRRVTLVVPDAPPVEGLFRPAPAVTSRTGYLRLHSRRADQWYAGMAERYDYSYSEAELRGILDDWSRLEEGADRVYAFFNNCHRGQAAQNAESMRRILGQVN
jgi:uncharacterized protein YecE (DUF72 family)